MRPHLHYLKYVLAHKWYVFLACFRLRVPIWLAIWHDMSKFSRIEWSPYVHQFYNPDGTRRSVRDASGAYDPAKQSAEFKMAWLHHQKLKHHWHSWVMLGEGGSVTALPIPEVYLREMVADWIGAGRANGFSDPSGWYAANSQNLFLHPISRYKLELILKDLEYE